MKQIRIRSGRRLINRSRKARKAAALAGGVVKTSYIPKAESKPGELRYRWDILNHLIKHFGYERYLEVGVCGFDLEGNVQNGENFKRIDCKYKDGVDPVSCEGVTHQMSSDEFFGKMGEEAFYNEDMEFDIIFIDGEHIVEQAQKDFENAAKHLAENGTIVMHDAYPNEEFFVDKHIIGGGRGSIWKVVADIIINNREWDVWTLKLDNSVAIFRKAAQSGTFGVDEIPWDPSAFTWEEVQANIDNWVNITTLEEFRRAF